MAVSAVGLFYFGTVVGYCLIYWHKLEFAVEINVYTNKIMKPHLFENS